MEGSEITEQVAGKVVVDDDLILKRKFLLPVLLVALGKESLNSYLQKVKVDVTEGSDKLAGAISDDTEAVVCATGFRPGWDLLAPWKVC
ncbi:hypothetical protein TSUD_91670 [Trifolium subterraneum]|uniref:FAD/NAD(P)-binding domain-containing protein n=1 Tax=Trifolium subterraneum TaxID=3900 RepID=A0A2Z6P3B5_TRISU|nr:hypothetical protein TSUD_91670 [Trifolium subterraneum]